MMISISLPIFAITSTIATMLHFQLRQTRVMSSASFFKVSCAAIMNLRIALNGARGRSICIFPSNTFIGDEEEKSNLLVYCSPGPWRKGDQVVLATFGLFIERSVKEFETGLPLVACSEWKKKLMCLKGREQSWKRYYWWKVKV